MISTFSLALLTILVAYSLNTAISLARNVQLAKRSGLPYVIVPYYSYNRLKSLFMTRTILRLLLKCLGEPSPVSWRTFVTGNWPWKHRYAPFTLLNTDTFLIVSPGGILLPTSDAMVAAQVLSRPADFPKPVAAYKAVSIYGDNIVAAEGDVWRNHRKLMSPVFSESNNKLVWKQSLNDGQAMLSAWLDNSKKPVKTLAKDTMLLSLSVIGRAGLGQTIQWPSAATSQIQQPSSNDNVSAGHEMSFTTALTTLLNNIYYIALLPRWILQKAPIKVVKQSHLAYLEWGQYLREIIASKRGEIANSHSSTSSTNDLLSQLLRENQQSNPESKSRHSRLSESEILGNLFMLVIAGHETSANSIHFCLALLAIHPQIQHEVQVELDQIFQGRSPEQWDYEKDLPKLLNSMLNAVLSEQLRLFPAAVVIPKYTNSPQGLKVDGKSVIIPAKTMVRLCIPGIHRNPKHWPSPSASSSHQIRESDLESFRPSRWFNSDKSWYQPSKGSYIPFSDGARACLGKRFAQVEILAVLALILSKHSVELAVHDSATAPGTGNASEAWHKARETARQVMDKKMAVSITLQIIKGHCIPVRIVTRGEENFAGQY